MVRSTPRGPGPALTLLLPLVLVGCSDGSLRPPILQLDAGMTGWPLSPPDSAPVDAPDAGNDRPAEAPDVTEIPDDAADDVMGDVMGDVVGEAACGAGLPDPAADMRQRCVFAAGARVADSLGVDSTTRGALPIQHLVVVLQENRSFDHVLGRLPAAGADDVDGFPATYSNPDAAGRPVTPAHLTTTCIASDPPHQWDAMHAGWDDGQMDGFYRSASSAGVNGQLVLGWYDPRDLPFYYWMYRTFAMSDRYFAAALGGTWANRDYLYLGSSYGVRNTGERALSGARSIFDALDEAHVAWGVYTSGTPRQDSLGWTSAHAGVHPTAAFFTALHDRSLPPVVFLDPGPGSPEDEHPAGDLQRGEAWTRQIVTAAVASPLWPHLALVFTYDESGGFFDHVPPPPACPAAPDQAAFDRLGVRVPLAVISPYARPGYVSHQVHSHTSVLRLIELLHDLPALTARDANSDALLDLFDFACPRLLHLPATPPAAGTGGCVH